MTEKQIMSELTRGEIELIRKSAGVGDPVIDSITENLCDMALRTHDAEARAERAESELVRLRTAMSWYACKLDDINRRGHRGDAARANLAQDAGKRAREALTVLSSEQRARQDYTEQHSPPPWNIEQPIPAHHQDEQERREALAALDQLRTWVQVEKRSHYQPMLKCFDTISRVLLAPVEGE